MINDLPIEQAHAAGIALGTLDYVEDFLRDKGFVDQADRLRQASGNLTPIVLAVSAELNARADQARAAAEAGQTLSIGLTTEEALAATFAHQRLGDTTAKLVADAHWAGDRLTRYITGLQPLIDRINAAAVAQWEAGR